MKKPVAKIFKKPMNLMFTVLVFVLLLCLGLANIASEPNEAERPTSEDRALEKATFGSGCFWCTEAVFQQLRGVQSVSSGYAGGETENPRYKDVTSGTTGHAEVVQVEYDPAMVSYEKLLEVFWKSHDPTTPNRQGKDVGTHYRSIILYHNETQRALAEKYMKKLDAAGIFDDPIVTQIEPLTQWHPAEKYHQNYFNENPGQGYCRIIIAPKVAKIRKIFADDLKSSD